MYVLKNLFNNVIVNIIISCTFIYFQREKKLLQILYQTDRSCYKVFKNTIKIFSIFKNIPPSDDVNKKSKNPHKIAKKTHLITNYTIF